MKKNAKNRFWSGFSSMSLYPATSLNAILNVRRKIRNRAAIDAIAADFAMVGKDLIAAAAEFEDEFKPEGSRRELTEAER